jgi:hypothetical protein
MTGEADSPSGQGIIDITIARESVNEYFRQEAERMRSFGAGLPDYKDPEVNLLIVAEREYDFGWVFDFNTRKYVESGDILESLLGNGPLIVDRNDGHIYTIPGSGSSREEYIAEFRAGSRRRVD